MHEASPLQVSTTHTANDLQPDAKSLFRNILAASPYGSRFYEDPGRSPRCKLLGINILATRTEKIWRGLRLVRIQSDPSYRDIFAFKYHGELDQLHTVGVVSQCSTSTCFNL
jgi:hypothetical protein